MVADGLAPLLANIERYVRLPEADALRLQRIARRVAVRRRQYLDQPGYVSRYRNYVLRGVFRSFLIDAAGKEHTVQIAVEDWFVSDFYSYVTREPATLYVEALEDSSILQMSYADIEGLIADSPALSEYFRRSTERAFAFSRQRALNTISLTAEARYLDMLARYPDIVGRVPQRIIASYLGMTPEFLSKIRSGLAAD